MLYIIYGLNYKITKEDLKRAFLGKGKKMLSIIHTLTEIAKQLCEGTVSSLSPNARFFKM